MAKKLDAVLVVDVEATCWEGVPPPGEEAEIVEIGLCVLDAATLERGERRSILVRPERSRVSEFCTQLTTLTQQQVESGITFADACAMLRRDFAARDRVWASYGDFDRRQFERQCQSWGITYPFGTRHLNVKTLCGLALGLSSEEGVAGALARLDLPLDGTHHRGGDDAWNIAAILAALLRRARTDRHCSPFPS